jgi:predicted ATPase/DNA-binding SARP family transcriptional activator/DNA-binding CsgD family transcriptional regulator
MRIQLLGEFRLECGGQTVAVNSVQLQSLLAHLILHRGSPQPRSRIAFALWPDVPEAQAYARLRKTLHRLRGVLPDADRRVHADGYSLHWLPDETGSTETDVVLFEDLADQAASPAALRDALALYRGDLLPECYDDWIVLERERLRTVYLGALAKLIRLLEDAGDISQAVRYAEQHVRDEPLEEAAHYRLIRLRALAGDRVGAVRAYRAYVTVLDRELGISPGAATLQLVDELHALPSEATATAAAVAPAPSNALPFQATSFVGRERESEQIFALLAPDLAGAAEPACGRPMLPRLVTLKGPGGCGKTRLSCEVARKLSEAGTFVDGLAWVDLTGLVDPRLVSHTICHALGLAEQVGRTREESLVTFLRGKEFLLVIDNCEHLIAACAEISQLILSTCIDVRILATSREPLRTPGEVVWPIVGLTQPRSMLAEPPRGSRRIAECDSVRLFVDRASAALPTFRLSDQNAADIARICVQLDGIPLAIEMAAARVSVLSVAELVERLESADLLLARHHRGARDKHATLRATLDWSYDLLSAHERALFDRLSVFAGGFTLKAAETVCADSDGGARHIDFDDAIEKSQVLDLLSGLVDRSLVMPLHHSASAGVRYRLLETSRQYAAEKLAQRGESTRLRRRHAEFVLAMVENTPPLRTEAATRELQSEIENLRAALAWGLSPEGDPNIALRLAGSLTDLWLFRRMLTEGLGWLRSCLAATCSYGVTAARGRALYGAGRLAYSQTLLGEARAFLEESIAIWTGLGDRKGLAFSLCALSRVAWGEGKFDEWDRLGAESTRLFRQEEDMWGLAWALLGWGLAGSPITDHSTSLARLEESIRLWRELGDQWGMASALNNLGERLRLEGDHRRAASVYEESLRLYDEIGDTGAMTTTVAHNLAHARVHLGELDEAARLFAESLQAALEFGNRSAAAAALVGLGCVAAARGWAARAIRILAAAQAEFDATGNRLDPADAAERDRALDSVRALIDDATFERLWSDGATFPLDRIVQEATAAPDTSEHRPPHGNDARKGRTGVTLPPSSTLGGLTARQADVVARIAAGSSNAAIAAAMQVDLKTVEAHVTRILRKLGCTSRAQIAAWAVAAGLFEVPVDRSRQGPRDK